MTIAEKRSHFARWYSSLAIGLLSVGLLFIALNLLIALILPSGSASSQEALENSEPGFSPTSFRSSSDQSPWPMEPLNYNILFFGGSTTEGRGVTDDQTIPVYFQSFMQNQSGQRVCCYNFGHPGYTSTQERNLFEQLLQSGARPNMVVFIDGVNDFASAADPESFPAATDGAFMRAMKSLPVARAVEAAGHRFTKSGPTTADFRIVNPAAISRYLFNKSAIESIAKTYDISTVFVFQPVPVYPDDPRVSLADWDQPGDQLIVHGYRLMAQHVKDNNMGDDFLWLADVHHATNESLYVDKWHYNAEFGRQIASRIYNFMQKNPEPAQQAQIDVAK
jgi:hypothetical protein